MDENKVERNLQVVQHFKTEWEYLPAEIVARILNFFMSVVIGNLVVGRFVCRMWRDLLPNIPGGMAQYDYAGVVAKRGFLNLLISAKQHRCPLKRSTFRQAVGGGNLKILTWLKRNGCPKGKHAIDEAMACGNLKVIKWLRQECFTSSNLWKRTRLAKRAARYGHLQVLKWLCLEGIRFGAKTCTEAAIYMYWSGYY